MKHLLFVAFFLLLGITHISAQVSIVKLVDWEFPPEQLTKVGNRLYFVASDGASGIQLWKSDGTSNGTVKLKDFANISWHVVESLTDVNGTLFFVAITAEHGHELWKSNGTPSGTVMVKDIFPGTNGSLPEQLTAVGSQLFFVCDEGVHGYELWKSDGTAAGTTLVTDIVTGPQDGIVGNLTAVNNQVFFNAGSYVFHDFSGLYKSDGTSAGTQLVKHFSNGTPITFVNVSGTLFFTLATGFDNPEVWESDGTEAGTQLVRNMCGDISQFANVNGTLFLGADDCVQNPNTSYELCKISPNGGNSGLVKNICLNGSSEVNLLTALGNNVFFAATDCLSGKELWRSDGTYAGTYMVKNICYGYESSYLKELTASNGLIYFTADPGDALGFASGEELWQSNGTEMGTFMVKDIYPNEYSSEPKELTDVNNVLYFTAYDNQNERQIWRTGGNIVEASGIEEATRLQIFPTLANDYISFNINDLARNGLIISIISPSGELVLKMENYNGSQIEVSALKTGVYFVQVYAGDEMLATGRFLKI